MLAIRLGLSPRFVAMSPGTRGARSISPHSSTRHKWLVFGAGEGNRTLVFSLEGCCSTIELHPRLGRSPNTASRHPQQFLCTVPDTPRGSIKRPRPLNIGRIRAYTDVSINT